MCIHIVFVRATLKGWPTKSSRDGAWWWWWCVCVLLGVKTFVKPFTMRRVCVVTRKSWLCLTSRGRECQLSMWRNHVIISSEDSGGLRVSLHLSVSGSLTQRQARSPGRGHTFYFYSCYTFICPSIDSRPSGRSAYRRISRCLFALSFDSTVKVNRKTLWRWSEGARPSEKGRRKNFRRCSILTRDENMTVFHAFVNTDYLWNLGAVFPSISIAFGFFKMVHCDWLFNWLVR